eukprot:3725137-Rhodomonas_salina.1
MRHATGSDATRHATPQSAAATWSGERPKVNFLSVSSQACRYGSLSCRRRTLTVCVGSGADAFESAGARLLRSVGTL